jgi:hypothetical protein
MRKYTYLKFIFRVELFEVICLKELRVHVVHKLGLSEARRRLEEKMGELMEQYEGKFTLESTWKDNTLLFKLAAMGVKTEGTLEIKDTTVTLSGTVPLVAIAFKKRIEESIKRDLEEILRV